MERLLTRDSISMQQVRAHLAGPVATLLAITAFGLFPGKAFSERDLESYELERLQRQYPKEIFDFCLHEHPFAIRNCLTIQYRIRKRILINAIEELGTYSEARALYDECLEYYPVYGAAPIGECVETRLVLHRKLDFEIVEQLIFEKCHEKWRRHSVLAIRNCAAHSANEYHEKGMLPDW